MVAVENAQNIMTLYLQSFFILERQKYKLLFCGREIWCEVFKWVYNKIITDILIKIINTLSNLDLYTKFVDGFTIRLNFY